MTAPLHHCRSLPETDPALAIPGALTHEERRELRRRKKHTGHHHCHSRQAGWPRCVSCRLPIHPKAPACSYCGQAV